ncbi:pyrroline-5-carboxylate reductase [Arenicella sp.]|nr:pyrroline-5-carboxylate reductase [Arenicella sp.]
MNTKLGFIGGGNMASSLIGGLLSHTLLDDFTPQDIMVFEPNNAKAKQLNAEFNIQLAVDNQQLLQHANVVVIAVKPQVLQTVLKPLSASFKETKPLIVSIVAGIRIGSIERWLDDQHAVVRVMPNTPALMAAGASGLFANERVDSEQKKITERLLNAVGMSRWVNSEEDIDTVTALSGSGPAYFMLFIKSLIDAAQTAGLDHDTATELALATASGSAKLIANSDLPLQTLIDNVTSPGGTTEQALLSFHADQLPTIVCSAFEAARLRSEEMAEQLGNS